MALMLDVPWSEAHLPVGYEGATDEIVKSGSPNVCTDGEDVLVVDFFGECNRVPDVRRYRIEQEDCCVPPDDRYRIWHDRYLMPDCDFSECTRQQELQENGSIVLLLESPHMDEYKNGNIAAPKRPACGETGRNIDQCLATVLLHIQEIGTGLIEPGCHVVISNPIQFQTSLYAIHEKSIRSDSKWSTLRNNVWRTLWNEEQEHIKQCFRTRLEGYHPKMIINACTSDLKPRVRTFVGGWITESNLEVHLYELAHPSEWENLRPERITLP